MREVIMLNPKKQVKGLRKNASWFGQFLIFEDGPNPLEVDDRFVIVSEIKITKNINDIIQRVFSSKRVMKPDFVSDNGGVLTVNVENGCL